jgi:hypothetical protein
VLLTEANDEQLRVAADAELFISLIAGPRLAVAASPELEPLFQSPISRRSFGSKATCGWTLRGWTRP